MTGGSVWRKLMYSLICWSVMWRPGKAVPHGMKNLLPIRPAATASQRAPFGAAPFAGFATSLGLRPPAVTHPATLSSRLTRVSHPVCRAALVRKHIALGVRSDGAKEILGLWLEQNEGAKFWLRVTGCSSLR